VIAPGVMEQPMAVAAYLPFDPMEVKLAAPVSRPGTVARAKLVARLSASPAPFASVIAPAGYGKTTLVGQWAEVDPRPFAWVSLDRRDDDVVVFLRYLAAAIHRVHPLPPEAHAALAGRPRGSGWGIGVRHVGTALARSDHPLVLVLDDLHAVSNPSCMDALAALLEYVPANSRIVVTSREEPALPLGRWRAQGWLQEIGVADVRMDERESGQLLEAAGIRVDASEVSDLTARTEGWPAGLYLAALSTQADATSAASPHEFVGDDRFVADYFRLELLSRMPAWEAEFLKCTSVLDRMCGGLCDTVLETTGSERTLETVARTNGFLVSLDRRGEWYRYHHLFGELLRSELERTEPEVVAELTGRAMTWCIENDLKEAAVAYGQAAGEMDTVARLIDELALPLYYDGRKQTVEEWLEWFAEDDLVRYPVLAVYAAWFHLLSGRPEEAARWLALADGATSTIPLADGSATVEPWVATLRAHMMRDGVEQALADADRALALLPPKSSLRSTALTLRGAAYALLGAPDGATADLKAALDIGLAFNAVDEIFVSQALLALLACRRGAWAEAAERTRAAQALVDETELGDHSQSAIVHVATARVALHEARSDDARAALARAHRLRPLLDHGFPWLTVQVGLEMTRAHLALGDARAARTILDETEAVLKLRPGMGLLVDDARELRKRVAATSGSAGGWAMSLTRAELRLLPYLATHLTFREIASRLFLSRNTVKTEAVSIYRKLGASSRSETIERAIEVGLLDRSIYPPHPNLTSYG
jgi:LuxR family transcriptional regulator, maltose regulon positive regulatory protein